MQGRASPSCLGGAGTGFASAANRPQPRSACMPILAINHCGHRPHPLCQTSAAGDSVTVKTALGLTGNLGVVIASDKV